MTETPEIRPLPIAQITPGDNDRTHFDPVALAELADSIAAHGLAQPITVRPIWTCAGCGAEIPATFPDACPCGYDGPRLPGQMHYQIVAGDRRPRIMLSPAKGSRKVARDILRRFFPKYHPIYLEIVAARRKAERDYARASAMLDELAKTLDGHARVGSYRDTPRLGDRSYKAGTPWRADAPRSQLEVTAYSREIKIELERLPLDLAREVCALVRERLDAVKADGS